MGAAKAADPTTKIAEIVAEAINFGRVGSEVITTDASLEGLGVDSLDRIVIVDGLENEFDISVTDEEAEGLVHVRDIVALVTRKIGEAVA